MSMPNLADRLRSIRKRRGFTQRELAAASGVSLSLIRKIEQAEREDTRLETLRKLAAALHVHTSDLIEAPSGEPGEGGDSNQWEPLQKALQGLHGEAPAEPPTVAGVSAALSALMPLFSTDQYSRLAVALPPLLRDADELGADERALRARLLHHVGWLLTQTRQFDAADVALSRALDEASDRLDAAATVNTLAWLRMRQGDLAGTIALASTWADEVEPRISRATMAELSAWGWLLVRLSTAAVRNAQPGDAEDAIRLARTAAVAMGGEYSPPRDFLRAFGPLTVAMKRAENAMVEERPDRVLALSGAIPLDDLRPTSNNRNRHLLDVAHARVKLRQHAEAFDVLRRVQSDAPEWITTQRYARDIFGQIISRRRTLTSDMREMAASIRLEY
ncbi:helix-turn-helix domain-containing protein [Actinomadura rayongensis]|uniref:Helix-turn-helix domain-containing protein n=1 Tax=Actinomadura rayongensis TaxID=1429076 RepID=A0A6I4WCU2_9ACTN|nr:helix-turn-helix transcriptional regulator [Actinomadura rayongensis]MXQ67451.1 helix-turn-helix domain-containing protein [Actinomadura rayongensis]